MSEVERLTARIAQAEAALAQAVEAAKAPRPGDKNTRRRILKNRRSDLALLRSSLRAAQERQT